MAKAAVIKKDHLPDVVEHKGKEYKMVSSMSAMKASGQPVEMPKSYVIVEVMNKRLRGKTDLHGKPYKPSQWVFEEQPYYMEKGGSVSDSRVDEVLNHYVGTALWITDDENDEPLNTNYSMSDIDEKLLSSMRADIKKFISENEKEIKESGMSDDDLGHDLWLTRNHHGSGFWDRNYDEDISEKLTKAAHELKGTDLYVGDDNKIHGMGSYEGGGWMETGDSNTIIVRDYKNELASLEKQVAYSKQRMAETTEEWVRKEYKATVDGCMERIDEINKTLQKMGVAEKGKIVTDPADKQKIMNSIKEGELTLRTGKFNGRKLGKEELEAVKKSVENAKAKIGQFSDGGFIEMTKEERSRLDVLQYKEDIGDLNTEENQEYENLVVKYRKTKEYKDNQDNEYAKGGQVKDIPFMHSNLYLVGHGNDTNGNHVVKVMTPNERSFSIQTNGTLPNTNRILKSTGKISELSKEDIEAIEKEVVPYVKEFGSASQKKHLRLYRSGNWDESFAKGGKASTFVEGVKAIQKKLTGTLVPKKYQKEYGKKYDSKEAKTAAQKIKGSQRAKELIKKYGK